MVILELIALYAVVTADEDLLSGDEVLDNYFIYLFFTLPVGIFLSLTAIAFLQRSRRYVQHQEERTSLWQTIARNYDLDEGEAIRVV